LQSENLQGLLDMGHFFGVITGEMSLLCDFYILNLVESKIVINFASEQHNNIKTNKKSLWQLKSKE
jgi:hypothetical protein